MSLPPQKRRVSIKATTDQVATAHNLLKDYLDSNGVTLLRLIMTGPILLDNGSTAAPGLAFVLDPDTGIQGMVGGLDNHAGLVAGHTLVLEWYPTGLTAYVPFLLADGSVGAPGLAFAADPDTGLWRSTNNHAVLSAGGVASLEWTNTVVVIDLPLLVQSGTLAAPGLAFQFDPTTGAWLKGAADGVLVAGGVASIEWTAGGATVPGGLNVGTATAAAAGEIKASSNGTIAGGLNVGTATAASAGQIKASAGAAIAGGVNVGTALAPAAGSVAASGDASIAGGVNVGTATAAAAGEVRASGAARLGSQNAYVVVDEWTVANNGVQTLRFVAGLISITNSTSPFPCLVGLGGGAGTVAIISDITTQYSALINTSPKTNIYQSGGAFHLQNLSGSSQTYQVAYLGVK